MLRRLNRQRKPLGSGGDLPVFAQHALDHLSFTTGYKSALPFPHLVVDDLFNPASLVEILREWPQEDARHLEDHNDGVYSKSKVGTTWKTEFGPQTMKMFSELAGPSFLKLLEKLTGIWGLIPDPYMFGGGLHATRSGGKLAVHADYNRHPIYGLDRRLNLLVYLNKGWSEENQGWLELWNSDMTSCSRKILPVFNQVRDLLNNKQLISRPTGTDCRLV